MHYHWWQTPAKKGTWLLWKVHIKQKSSATLTVVDQSNTSAVYISSSESCEPKRYIRWWNKLKESIFKNNNQIDSTITTRTWVLSTKWTRTWSGIILISEWKYGVCLNGVLKGEWEFYRVKKDQGDESKPLLAFERDVANVIHLPCRNSKYLIRCLLWWHKKFPGAIWTQTYSEPLQTSNIECFCIKG